MNIQGRGGDRAHEATTVLAREAYRAAGNPAMYPEQLREGLRPWQPRKLYFNAGAGVIGAGGRGGRGGPRTGAVPAPAPSVAPAQPPRVTRVNTAMYDELLGRTYAEIGADAHSNHKCQGTVGPAGASRASRRAAAAVAAADSTRSSIRRFPGQMQKDEASLFDDIDITLAGVAQFAGANPPAALTAGLAAVVDQAVRAKKAFDAGDDAGTRRADRSGSDCAARAARPARLDAAERRRALRDRLPARDSRSAITRMRCSRRTA